MKYLVERLEGDRREVALLMLSISAGADMNSSAAGRRSHRRRIKLRGSLDRANGNANLGAVSCSPRTAGGTSSPRCRVIERAGQTAQRGIGHGLVPVVKNGVERFFAIIRRKHPAQDGGHPQQQSKASFKADAAECRERHDCDHSQTEANDHFRRLRGLRQIANATCYERGHDSISKVRRSRPMSCDIFLARLGPDTSSKR